MSNLRYVQTPAISLYTGMSGTDVTARVTPFPVDLDGNKLTMTDFGDTSVFTVDPKVSGIEEVCYFTGITDNGDNTGTLTGLTRDLTSKYPYTTPGTGRVHGSSATVVFGASAQTFGAIISYINSIAIAGAPNASASVQGLVQAPTTAQVNSGTAAGSTGALLAVTPDTLLASIYGLLLPASGEKTLLTSLYAGLAGTPFLTGRRTAPAGWLMYDGSAVSRASYPLTFAALCPSQSYTATNASPMVVTAVAHGLVAGDKIHFSAVAGGHGITANTDYYVLSTSLAADTFKFALSPSGTAVNATGTESGTLYKSAFGKGDGSTTFTLPDMRGKSILGLGATNNITLSFEAGAVSAGADTIAVPDGVFPSQGQAVTLTTTGTLPAGLAVLTTYYVVRLSSTSIQLSASQANANAATPVVVDITDTGSAGGVHTITYALTARNILGQMLGEETHGIAVAELASHTHSYNAPTGAVQSGGSAVNANSSGSTTGAAGGNSAHNNMAPSIAMNWMGLAI